MSSVLEYKGYHTKVIFDAESNTLHGKIEGIRDFVNFEASNIDDIKKEFHSAVDDYLELCEEIGKEPDKEYRGSFNVRIDPQLHRELVLEADRRDISMNKLIEDSIREYLHGKPMPESTIIHVKENETKSPALAPPFVKNIPFPFPMSSMG